MQKYVFKSKQAYQDWLSREDDIGGDGIRVYDGLFDPFSPFRVTISNVLHEIGWDIVDANGEPLTECEWLAFVPEDFELIEKVE